MNPANSQGAWGATGQGAEAPDWDLSAYFSELGGPEYRAFRESLRGDLEKLAERVAELGAVDPASAPAWIDVLLALEEAGVRFGHWSSYLGCVTAADSANELGQRERSGQARFAALLAKLLARVRAALGAASERDFASLLADARLQPVRHYLVRLRQAAERAMPSELEGLSADLGVDGIDAFGRLYTRISGKLSFDHCVPGAEPRRLAVSVTRTLLEDPDPAVRVAALRGSALAWESVSETLAACLNAISGTRLTLYARRGFAHFLDPALFAAAIERETLDAMWSAVRARQELPREYLRHKARLLGVPRLGFQDLMAPLPRKGEARIPWERGKRIVCEAFGSAYPRLREFAEHALGKRWVDHQPRRNKQPGGFCTSSHWIGESRVFLTYGGAMGDVQTLAHELGHAYHNWLMRDLRSWARSYPMTLAETASTFAEQLVLDAALSRPDTEPEQRAALLDSRLQDAEVFLLNIPMRFDFEHELYTRRASGELSARELGELMLAAQRANYADALAADQLDPWFWASKLHFYITGTSFYNFPYTFGYLFTRGLAARASREGPDFFPRYEALLRSTGSAPAEQVARDALGVDLRSPDFWSDSIDWIEADLAEFRRVTGEPPAP